MLNFKSLSDRLQQSGQRSINVVHNPPSNPKYEVVKIRDCVRGRVQDFPTAGRIFSSNPRFNIMTFADPTTSQHFDLRPPEILTLFWWSFSYLILGEASRSPPPVHAPGVCVCCGVFFCNDSTYNSYTSLWWF